LTFTAAGTSAAQPTVSGLSGSFPTQLPIKAGDAIGVDNPTSALIYGTNAGPTIAYWTPLLADGATLMGTGFSNRELRVQATVEPDVDCDGKGDETQDPSLTDGPCKSPPVQTLTAKRKQKLSKAAVSERLDKAGTVTLQARVKVPKKTSRTSRGFRILAKSITSKEVHDIAGREPDYQDQAQVLARRAQEDQGRDRRGRTAQGRGDRHGERHVRQHVDQEGQLQADRLRSPQIGSSGR
jgi:hypothetical protein